MVNKSHFSSRSTAWLAIAAVLGLAWLPPEHVHEMDEHGEHKEVVHRHLAPHHQADPGAIFDHQDGDAHYLSSDFTLPETPATSIHLSVVSLLPLLEPHMEPGWALESLHVRVHDPPWAVSVGLRAPPAFVRHA